MELSYPKDDLDEAVLAFKRWLRTESGWLLILNNADDPGLLKPFLNDAEHGHVLITSRTQDLQDIRIFEPFKLDPLSVKDASAFLLSRCGREDADAGERDAAERLAHELGGLPLALEQAAAYIWATNGMKFRLYLESYRSRGLKLLNAHRPALGEYPESVVTTWAANFDAVQEKSPAAADVLRFSAFVASDSIPFELVSQGAPELGASVAAFFARGETDSTLVNDLVQELARYSLVRIDGKREVYGLHNLVQEVVKASMDEPTRREWGERAVRAANRAFSPVAYNNWPLCDRLLSHVLALASWIERRNMASKEASRLLGQTAYYLQKRGQYIDAESLHVRTTEITRSALGEHHSDYASSLNNLASLYRETGRYAEAEPLYKEAMEIRRTTLAEQHPAYAASLNNLAGLYRDMGRRAEAELLYLQAVEIHRTALGEHNSHYAASLTNLAALYHAIGRHAEAEPLFKEAIGISRTVLGEHHPDYAASLSNLADLYRATGRHAEAEPLFKEAMEIHRTALGEHHPDYASSLIGLALLYRFTNRHAEAEPLYLQAIEIYRTALGEHNSRYATSLNNLANLYVAADRYAEAEPLFRRAMEIRRTVLGEHHLDYAASLSHLSWLYEAMGRYTDAEPLLLKATEIIRVALGERHPDYAASLNDLAGLYRTMGRHAEAERLVREGLGP
jgi:tetratricopeptide (TPR) repeat protein